MLSTSRLRAIILVAGTVVLTLGRPAAAQDTTRKVVTGTWLARDFRLGPDIPALTLVMELEELSGEVRGQIRWEQYGAGATSGSTVPLRGWLTGDSLVLHDTRGAPTLAGRLEGSRYLARIALESGRLGGPISLTRLGPNSKIVRFERR